MFSWFRKIIGGNDKKREEEVVVDNRGGRAEPPRTREVNLFEEMARSNNPPSDKVDLNEVVNEISTLVGNDGDPSETSQGDTYTGELVPLPAAPDGYRVINEEGGFSYKLKNMEQVKRFLVLGTEGNTYYAKEKERREENVECVISILKLGRHEKNRHLITELLNLLEEYSCTGRVYKEDAILIALATCALFDDVYIKQEAYKKVVKICNIPTKLFAFVELTQGMINKTRKELGRQGDDAFPKELRRKKKNEALEDHNPVESVDDVIDDGTEKSKKKLKRHKKKLKQGPYKKFNTTDKRSSGWGRMRRRGIGSFYTDPDKDTNRLLYLMTKYKQRGNWNHRQVLGYCHANFSEKDEEHLAKHLVVTYCLRGYDAYQKKIRALGRRNSNSVDGKTSQIQGHIKVLEEVSKLQPDNDEDVRTLCERINEFGVRADDEDFTTAFALPGRDSTVKENTGKKKVAFQLVREHLPNGFLRLPMVWEALLQDMPMTAMLRNLGRMTSCGLFEKQDNVDIVTKAFGDPKRLKKARIHPVKLLIGLKAYEQGKNGPAEQPRFAFFSSSTVNNKRPQPVNQITWSPHGQIKKALDDAFYLSFKQPDLQQTFKTGKKFMLALDVSGSMTFEGCFGCEQITPAIAATALSMVTWNIEEHVEMVAFGGRLEKLEAYGLSKDLPLDQAMSKMRRVNFGSTDCSLPMTYAKDRKLDVDVFIVYTDSDTGYGTLDPAKALKQYRQAMRKPNAKLIVMAMTSNGFTIADPEDKNMLDIVGFDANVPEMISEFVQQNHSS